LPFSKRAGRISNYSGKSVCPRAGLLMSHSPWYRRIQTYTCRQAQESRPLSGTSLAGPGSRRGHQPRAAQAHEAEPVPPEPPPGGLAGRAGDHGEGRPCPCRPPEIGHGGPRAAAAAQWQQRPSHDIGMQHQPGGIGLRCKITPTVLSCHASGPEPTGGYSFCAIRRSVPDFLRSIIT
jgi:hypothetical protein